MDTSANNAPDSTTSAKRACTQCRQQKARCDSNTQPDKKCSRCRRLNLACFISGSFKRQHKRSRLTELEQEAEALRKKLRASGSVGSASSVQGPADQELSSSHLPDTLRSRGTIAPLPTQAAPSPTEPTHASNSTDSSAKQVTISRCLNDVVVTAREIDELFDMFFHDYSPSFQVLDHGMTPNEIHSQSDFLFWAIIAVACRTYPSNSTLFTTLSSSIIDLALLSSNSSSRPIFGLQGLLLFLNWPPLRDSSKLETTYPLTGILMHRAKQLGLHKPLASHEFRSSRERSLRLSESQLAARFDLWAKCVIIYKCTCLSKGQLPQHIPIEVSPKDPCLQAQLRYGDLVTRCCAAIIQHGIQDMSPDHDRALELILEAYINHLNDIALNTSSGRHTMGDASLSPVTLSATGNLCLWVAQLNIQIFHLYRKASMVFHSPLATLLTTACKVLDVVETLLNGPYAPPSPPHHVTYALLLSNFTLLRLVKYPTSSGIDLERATSRLCFGIQLAKKSSVHTSDIFAKMALCLTQLWNSPKAFRNEDGSPDMHVKVFNRLAMGPALDAVWRWYDLFDEQGQISTGRSESHRGASRHDTAPPRNILPGPAQTSIPGGDFSSADVFGDLDFADFGWALGDEFFTL